jgi:RNA polymerase sigma-70 factor, ECF subfamily
MDDDGLLGVLARGDDAALRELYARHARWMAVRLRRVLPVDAVEDVLQETFVAVWRGARRYRPDGRAEAWLWGIARRQAALWVRRHGYPPPEPPPEPSTEPPGGADEAEVAAARLDLAAALAALHPDDRDLVRLLYVEDRSVAEVADRLRLAEGTVKSRAYRVRRLLRAALGGGGA